MTPKEAWQQEIDTIAKVKYERNKLQKELEDADAWLVAAYERRDEYASTYAEERVAEGKNVVESDAGTTYLIKRSRKGRGGAEPKNKFYLEEVKR